MNVHTEQYLHALINWADEVQQKLSHSHREFQLPYWREIDNWKNDIQAKIDDKQELTQEEMYRVKEDGEQILQTILANRKGKNTKRIGVGEHQLPPLPYAYDALEPYISKEIMRLHHDKHHKSYVEGLNNAEKMIQKWTASQNKQMLRHWMREQSFNGSGHFLHTIFWNNMSPNGGGTPKGQLMSKIKEDFSSFDAFKKLFTNAAQSVQGTGWAMLVWELQSGRLAVQTVEKHNMYALWDVIPLLVLDVWEHAYYLQYETDRNKYVENWWNVVNWDNVNDRFNRAQTLTWL
ncbi:Fe-Mn family superoxide dismutase [Salirhabdus euzebyi]|uniref:superoxide dismutase n=1 Tax=Salirhabdus euzebyi TaxID=394506 RepID=A0A841QA34_9BACI|nr:superoxide dismutase [Salirhabdus euzebyi]MBB6455288.1 Fe-Mn family superoxide dismutase [Salirhabdus euzebyi]